MLYRKLRPYELLYKLHYLIKKKIKKKYHTFGTFLNSNGKFVERGKIDTSNTQIHDSPLAWLATGTSIKSGGAKQCLLGPKPHN